MTSLNVNEIFYSVQGEGPLVGTPSVFLRLNGCNLRCSWCDSKYTWKDIKGENQNLIDTFAIATNLSSFASNTIVITGGEPLIQHDGVYELVGRFKDYHFTIETNGTLDPHPDLGDAIDMWMVSPKKGAKFTFDYQGDDVFYKFVLDRKDGLDWIDSFVKDYEIDPAKIFLMPQAEKLWQLHDNLPGVIEVAKDRDWRVSPRLHITAYGDKRGV